MTLDANVAVIVCLAGLAALAVVDGVYVHLVREKLHRRAETRVEHWIHTGRALAFVPILVLFFGRGNLGLGVAFLVVDQILELADMSIERRSRAYSQGLRTSEYLLHGGALTLRGAAIAFSLVAVVPSAEVTWFVRMLLPGAIAGATLHVVLAIPVFRRVPA